VYYDFTAEFNTNKIDSRKEKPLYYKNNDSPYFVCEYAYSRDVQQRSLVTYIHGTTADGAEDTTPIYETDFSNQPLLELEYVSAKPLQEIPPSASQKRRAFLEEENQIILDARQKIQEIKGQESASELSNIKLRLGTELEKRKELVEGKSVVFIADLKNKEYYFWVRESYDIYRVHIGPGSLKILNIGAETDIGKAAAKKIQRALQGTFHAYIDDKIKYYTALYYSEYFKKSRHETVKLLSGSYISSYAYDAELYKLFFFLYTESEQNEDIREQTTDTFGLIFI
jgi:hypothetical protein